jgi:putative lumazine-binding protein
MKRFLMGIGTCLLLLFTIAIHLQDAIAAVDDSSTVRARVTDYIEAYYAGDAARMQQTMHPHYLKHVIHGDIPMREMTSQDVINAVRKGPANIPQSNRTEQVTVLDVSGNIATAKLVTPGWVDYITLSKEVQDWKIVSVVQKIEP